jgi:hypothetical protein
MERRSLLAVFALAVLIAAAVAAWRWWMPRSEPDAEPARASAPAPPAPAAAPEPVPTAPAPEVAAQEPIGEPDLPGESWTGVDLDEVRAALPENLYWETAAPTQDPRLLREREEEKERRNVLYGKVLSGTGTDAEILAYFEQRQRLSTDYIQFTDYVLEHYEARLSEQDLELVHLARRLHLARLQEIPRRLQEARDRKRAQDAAREAWLADEAEFGSEPPNEQ